MRTTVGLAASVRAAASRCCLVVVLLAGALTAQERRLVVVGEDAFPARRALLQQLGAAARDGDTTTVAARRAALVDGTERAQVDLARALAAGGGRLVRSFWLVPVALVEGPPQALDRLSRRRDVLAVREEGRWPAHIKTSTDDHNHHADFVQQTLGLRGQGVALALLDSGIDTDVGQGVVHPAFADANGTSRIAKAVGIATPGDVEDLTGHGSAVAAVTVARDWGNGFGLSDDGFAPDASVLSYKVTSGTSMTVLESDVIAAWQQVLVDRASHPIKVANFSFAGSPDPTSPGQQAACAVALYGDVLVVTSAGNDGQTPDPTASSQSNANGLAVGAVVADHGQPGAHRVTAFSSYGPLPGDGARWFPDLVACGDGVVSVQIDTPGGVTVNPGTSFSAPMVAGTALLLRSTAPWLTAFDTKALILNSVEDVTAANPGKSRFDYGLGLLRTDLAVEGLMQGQVRRGVVDTTKGADIVPLPIAVQAGVPYAATLVWPRLDLATKAWADLDLRVLDAAGAEVARSDSPRNLYERVLFTPKGTAMWTLEVDATQGSGVVPFTVAFAPAHGGGRQPARFDRIGVGCAGSAPDPDAGVVVPLAAHGVAGNTRTRVPFSHYATRLQQVIAGSGLPGPFSVSALAFRRDEQQGDVTGYDATLEVALGTTSIGPDQLAPTFQSNVQGPLTTVLAKRSVRFPGAQGLPPGPAQWDWLLPLDAPIVLDPRSTNLLIEVRVWSHSRGSQPFPLWLDAVQGAGVARVYTDGQPNGTQGIVDDVAIVTSLVPPGFGGGVPDLQADGRPSLGGTCTIVLRHARAGAPAVLRHGTTTTNWLGVPLPFDLSVVGAPSCLLRGDTVLDLPVPVRSDGTAEIAYPIPATPWLEGATWVDQWLVLDPAANGLGVVLSGAGVAKVGG